MAKIITKYEPELLSIDLHTEGGDGGVYDIKNCKTKFFIQTPRLRFKTDRKGSFQLIFEGKQKSKVNDFYIYMTSIERTLKSKYRAAQKTSSSLQTNFKLPVNVSDGISFKIEYDESCMVYDKNQNIIKWNSFVKNDTEATFIILCECIKNKQIIWKPVQALSYTTEKTKATLTGFNIRNEEDSEDHDTKKSKKKPPPPQNTNESDSDSDDGASSESDGDDDILINL